MIERKVRGAAQQRGIALLSVIVLLIVFLIFASAVMTQLAQEVNSSKTNGVSNKALAAADAGVHGMIVAIEEALQAGQQEPASITYTYPEAVGKPNTKYDAQIDNRWSPLSLGGSRFYLITSTGTVDTGVEKQTRTVRAIVRAEALAQFASFSNFENNQQGKTVWYTPNQHFDGQVYSGGPMHVQYDTAINNLNPIFRSSVDTVNNPMFSEFQGGKPVDDSGDWGDVIAGGQPNFHTGVTALGLPQPQKDVVVASEAYNGTCCSITTTFPTCSGLCMNGGDAISGGGKLTSGLYVGADAVISGVSGLSSETFTIHSPTKAYADYTVTVDFAGNTTTVVQGSTKAVYNGVPSGDNGPGTGNGAFFVDGNATVTLPSVIHGQYTIAVPDYKNAPGNPRNITLAGNGSLLYNDPNKDQLGLWANNIVLSTNTSNIEIDASIIAGYPGEAGNDGGFYYNKCTNQGCGNVNQGTLKMYGSLAENIRGAVGRFFGGNNHLGFDRQITYDQRLAANPPPFNPVDGAYDITAWEDLGN